MPISSRSKLIPLYAALAVFFVGAAFFAGVSVGIDSTPTVDQSASVLNKDGAVSVDFAPFWKAWNVLSEKFVPASTTAPVVDDSARVWGAIEGLAESVGDPYTVFLPPEETRMFFENVEGNFQGVGMEVGIRHDILTVIAPLKGTPAEKAGILPGDKIIQIDDTSTARLSIDEAVQRIRGEKGTSVKLKLVREDVDEPIDVTVIRDVIEVPTIETEVTSVKASDDTDESTSPLVNNVYVLRLFSFTGDSTKRFADALRDFAKSGTNKLIIDLRGNPGGFLESAVDMASWFLPSGKIIVRQEGSKSEEDKVWRSKGYDIFTDNLKLVVLVNGGSASASEILAGALSEHGAATVVGTQTFGKGSVQELVEITPDTALKVTVARWLTPNGKSISEEGITPDVVVSMSSEDIKAKKDPQLAKAIEILTKE
ncbi:MAG: Carboxy-terminal-processing protease [Parcubacteria group bacterium Greene0416_14]|nr:MAG: Carboxy-terminal-processing protease [Parcubacteria group bacterium Greene0416_14]TSD01715.1 MAG: Carboxy-terminal-processing protease [Parcubacteria group bacterium Greene1014_15]